VLRSLTKNSTFKIIDTLKAQTVKTVRIDIESLKTIHYHMKKVLFVLLLLSISSFSQEIALVKYSGGGDWYANHYQFN
jgi:hypothetical protein